MRQYDDPVEVRRGEAEDPDQFLWRGRLWKVRAVVAHWVDARLGGDVVAERELWRVEAGRGMAGLQVARPGRAGEAEPEDYGVFDLSFDGTDGRWQLVGSRD
jgi:hypothetical protein